MANTALYATGTVAVLETKLLSRDKFNRMIDAPSLDEAIKVLTEINYADGLKISKASDYNELLVKEQEMVGELISSLSSDRPATNAFLVKHDFHNLKTLYKAEVMQERFSNITGTLYYDGLIDIGVLQAEMLSGGRELSRHMREAIEYLDEQKSSGQVSPKTIDVTVDRHMYSEISEMLKKSRSKAARNYFVAEIDLTNILTMLRNKLAQSGDDIAEQLVDGGSIEVSALIGWYEGADFKELLNRLCESKYSEIIQGVKDDILADKNLSRLERSFKNHQLWLLKQGRENMEKVDPLLYYFVAKNTEVDNIRLIMVCKHNKVPKALIHQRLRDLYA